MIVDTCKLYTFLKRGKVLFNDCELIKLMYFIDIMTIIMQEANDQCRHGLFCCSAGLHLFWVEKNILEWQGRK